MDVNDSEGIEALRSILQVQGAQPFPESELRNGDLLLAHKDSVLIDTAPLDDTPERLQAGVTFSEIGSLIDYCQQFRTGSSRAFVDRDGGNIQAILDYHGDAAAPSWCTHRASFQAVETVDWKIWTANNEKPFSQMEWVEFLEDNINTIREPDGADMQSLCANLEQKKKVNFRSSVKVDSGTVRFAYDEEVETKGGTQKGQIEIPSVFKLGIQPFEGCDLYALLARLRYRITDGKLTFRYRLDRPDLVWNDAMKDAVETFRGEMQEAEGPPFPVHQLFNKAKLRLPEREVRFKAIGTAPGNLDVKD